jgi:23S rRNA (uracil1939-C5)-methyltransferase
VPIEECHLPETAINRLVPQMDFEGDAALERVSIRAGSGGELLMLLESASPGAPPLAIEAGISVAHMFEQHTLILVGEDHVILRVLGRDFRVSAGAFFQVNTAVAEKMVLHVLSALPAAPQTVIDAYCGVGLFSAFLAPRCERLISVEASPAACEDFGANLDEFQNVELYEDAVERVLPALDAKPNVILVDPPRAGLERAALDSIARMDPEMLMYVSCDPSTLARDAARLIKAGYRLEGVTPFDLFPQTYHIESISLFRR